MSLLSDKPDVIKDGLVSNSDELSRKTLQLEEELKNETISNDLLCEQIKKQDSQLKDMACENDTLCMENGRLKEKLEIATKALKEYADEKNWRDATTIINTDYFEYERSMYDLKDNGFEEAQQALKEMEGVK